MLATGELKGMQRCFAVFANQKTCVSFQQEEQRQLNLRSTTHESGI